MRRLVALVLLGGLGVMAALLPWSARRGGSRASEQSSVGESVPVGEAGFAERPASVAEGTREPSSPGARARSPDLEPVPTATDVELVECVVRVTRDGEPLEGLEVGNEHPWTDGQAPLAWLDMKDPRATQVHTTDANGIARFTGVPRGLSAFWLLHPECGPIRFSGMASSGWADELLVRP